MVFQDSDRSKIKQHVYMKTHHSSRSTITGENKRIQYNQQTLVSQLECVCTAKKSSRMCYLDDEADTRHEDLDVG